MSVDTAEIRTKTMDVRWQPSELTLKLCDEIDRLRKGLAELEQEWDRSDEELAQLREQLRPRSIKDEPPPPNVRVLAFMEAWNPAVFGVSRIDEYYTHWLPMPPAPTQPDAFEEWAKPHEIRPWLLEVEGIQMTKAAAKVAWDAAIQSTKHEKTNPMG